MSREFYLKSEIEVSFLIGTLDRHALILHELACLWANLFVHSNCHCATVESSESAWKAFKCLKQRDLLFVDQVMTRATVAFMLSFFELNNKAGSQVARRLVAHLFEYEFGAFRVTRLNFDRLAARNRSQRLCIVIDNFSSEVDLLH